jgi:PilZ domain
VKHYPVNWDELLQEVVDDRRRGKRLLLTFPIEISGVDRQGQSGCRIVTNAPLAPGDVISIRLLVPEGADDSQKNMACPFEVAWVEYFDSGWTAGTQKLAGDKPWKVTFPPDKEPPKIPTNL